MNEIETVKAEKPKETLLVNCETCAGRVSASVELIFQKYYDPPVHSVLF